MIERDRDCVLQSVVKKDFKSESQYVATVNELSGSMSLKQRSIAGGTLRIMFLSAPIAE
jgi:hypothetical protein